MKLPTIPSNMVLTNDGRYLLVPSMSLNKIFVIDIYSDIFLKDIEVGKLPSSILISGDSKKAYVANKLSSSISEIDLKNMTLTREIKVIGNPDNLAANEDVQNIYYNDAASDTVYLLNLGSGISTKVMKADNISKIALSDKNLFILSRSSEELIVYDLTGNKEVTRIKVGQKPVDFRIIPKTDEIYVLSAGSDEINIIDTDTFKLKKSITLNSGGFPSKITFIEKENKILITNQNSYQIVIYDTDREKIMGYIPTSKNISFLQVSR